MSLKFIAIDVTYFNYKLMMKLFINLFLLNLNKIFQIITHDESYCVLFIFFLWLLIQT